MIKSILVRLTILLGVSSVALFSYIHKQNEVTQVKIEIPKISKEIKILREENTRLNYEIECFERPDHLMELSRSSRYAHLKYPFLENVLTVNLGYPDPQKSWERGELEEWEGSTSLASVFNLSP